jgi:hypothetical protein
VHNMRGQLRLKSEENRGTRFVLILTFGLTEPRPIQQAPESESGIVVAKAGGEPSDELHFAADRGHHRPHWLSSEPTQDLIVRGASVILARRAVPLRQLMSRFFKSLPSVAVGRWTRRARVLRRTRLSARAGHHISAQDNGIFISI